jgi:predicted  nucleic acid-binding Zn-ribbon protein
VQTNDLAKLLDDKLTSLVNDLATIKQDLQTLHLRLARVEHQREQTFTTDEHLKSLPNRLDSLISKLRQFPTDQLAQLEPKVSQLDKAMSSHQKQTKKFHTKLDKISQQLDQLLIQNSVTEPATDNQPNNPGNVRY